MLATGFTPVAAVWAGAALLLGALSMTAITRALLGLCGITAGSILAALFVIGQTALVGWLWKSAAIAGVSKVWQVVSNLLPLNWTTAAVTVAGNEGEQAVLWAGIAVLLAVTLVGLSAKWWALSTAKTKTLLN